MLWLGQRARQLARVVAVAPRASAPHQLRNPDDQQCVTRGVAHYSQLSLHSQRTSSDISDVPVAQRNALPSLESPQHEQLIPAQKQHQSVDVAQSEHSQQSQQFTSIAEQLIATLRVALQHRNGGAAHARATASVDVVRRLAQHSKLLHALPANPQLTTQLIQDLARCGPVPHALTQPATPVLQHLLTSAAAQCPPNTLLGNITALISLSVPLPLCSELQNRLDSALGKASAHITADLLWCVMF